METRQAVTKEVWDALFITKLFEHSFYFIQLIGENQLTNK